MIIQIKNILILAAITGTLSLYSCKENKEKNEDPEPMQNETHEGEMGSQMEDEIGMDQTTAEFKDLAAAAVYNHYIAIKTALVQTDAELAQDHAKKMIAELENTKANEEIATAARKIATSTNVNEQREAFSEFTKSMAPILEGALKSGEIYQQYCPMAFEGKGDFWYSNSKEIRNPYFGDKMLKCGRVEATIN
ncbi:MAG: DUF3347 domain-containing protein [Flavobacterium sp.]|nr:DUF3347 domain-containing protein [Flavobacterium sp.]